MSVRKRRSQNYYTINVVIKPILKTVFDFNHLLQYMESIPEQSYNPDILTIPIKYFEEEEIGK